MASPTHYEANKINIIQNCMCKLVRM